MYNILKDLMLCRGVSGRENKIAEKISGIIAPYCDECYTDAMGNLIAVKKSKNENAKKIMLCAHMDEIGFIATYIEDNGMIRISNMGGINWVSSAYTSVVFENGVRGALVPESGVKADAFSPEKFYIDIGASNRREAERKVKIGDTASVEADLKKLIGNKVMGRPIDDRIGCAIMLEIAADLAEASLDCDIYYLFSVEEEVGCRGAAPAGFSVAPDAALVFDVTRTGDSIGCSPMAVKLGDGAAIKAKDSSLICDPDITDRLISLAKESKIKYQIEVLTAGGTDTSSIQCSGIGVRAGALSIPSRYIHSNVEMISLADAEACAELAKAFICRF